MLAGGNVIAGGKPPTEVGANDLTGGSVGMVDRPGEVDGSVVTVVVGRPLDPDVTVDPVVEGGAGASVVSGGAVDDGADAEVAGISGGA